MRPIFCLLLICTFVCGHAQLPDSMAKKVDAVLADYDKTNGPGCALAILKDGKILYQRGYGMSNLEHNIAISPSSIFHVASVSKQFTAAAILRLSLEGKLSLNDDIRQYIPEMPDFGHRITFNNLLHHTSGLRDQWDLQALAGWRDDDLITETDILEMLARQKALNFIPGDEYLYCNTGFTLAGIAVKKITGVSLRAYADSVFFKPLGMNHTHFHSDHAEITPNRTQAYEKDDQGKWKISIPVFDNYGATSLFTTVEDLAKWDENFYTKKIGGDAFISLLQHTDLLNDKTPQNYAYGLLVRTYKGYKTVEHSGADAGYRCNFIRFPDSHFSVILLANLANINTAALSNKIADLFLPDKTTPAPMLATDSSIVKGWAGDYFDASTQSVLNLSYKSGALQLGSNKLLAASNSVFTLNTTMASFSGDSLHAKLALNGQGSKIKNYDKVKTITLQPAALQEYTGNYYSAELNTQYKLLVKDSSLQVKTPRYPATNCGPYLKDIFMGNFILRFARNKKNGIEGFYLSTGRSRNLYFEKLAAR